MDERKLFLKTQRKLVAILVVYLGIAFACFGFVLFMGFSNKNEGEALDLSELVLNNQVEEGQYVRLDVEVYPTLMLPKSEKDSQLYFVTDVNGHVYIADLSRETYRSIIETINGENGAASPVYHLEGMTVNIDEQVLKMALSNSSKIFKNEELNRDNFSEYLDGFYIKDNYVSDRMVSLYKIIALLGVFFLVLALGHVVPAIVRTKKGDFGIYDEKKMMQALEKYLPDHETLTAGIYSVGVQTEIRQVFGKCRYDGEKLIPDENGTALQVTKGKCAKFEVYVGITQHYLILSECKQYQHFYKFDEVPGLPEGAAVEIDTCIPVQDIGNCFPLAEIQSCALKKTGKGDMACLVTMKNGSFIKLNLPKNGGAGMPNHARYLESIVACLSAQNKLHN